VQSLGTGTDKNLQLRQNQSYPREK